MCSKTSEQLKWEQWMFPTCAPFNFCNLTRLHTAKKREYLSLSGLYYSKTRRLRDYLKDTFNFFKETPVFNQNFFFNQRFYWQRFGCHFLIISTVKFTGFIYGSLLLPCVLGWEKLSMDTWVWKDMCCICCPKLTGWKMNLKWFSGALALLPLTENFKALSHFFFFFAINNVNQRALLFSMLPTTHTTRMAGSFGI